MSIRLRDKNRKVIGNGGVFPGALRPTVLALTGAAETIARPGFLYANGAVVKRYKYPALFRRIGTSHNTGGEAVDEFRLPDCRGVMLACDLDGRAAGGTRMAATRGVIGGEELHVLTKAETPKHVHDKGSLAFTGVGNHGHGQTFTMGANNNAGGNSQDRVRSGWQSGAVGGGTGWFSGSTASVTHSHPSGEWSGSTESGAADGLTGTGHSNVPPVLGCAVMVAY